MVEIAIFNVQRAITPQVGKPELQFMCSACYFIVHYICVKFRENIFDSIRIMERTRMMEALTDGRALKNFGEYSIMPSPLKKSEIIYYRKRSRPIDFLITLKDSS